MNGCLPIQAYRPEILRAVADNPAVVITAETGAGKSTQVPQYLLDLLGDDRQIIVTQPRRLAARTVAGRVAEEQGVKLGSTIGYRTAQERADSKETKVLFCTDGLQMVREITGSGRAQVLVIDEVHEWNLNIEVLVAWARQRIREGSGFKVVLMSATLEAEKLAGFFDNCPVISVPGRLFPVERRISSRPIEDEVETLVKAGRNVLAFQPGKAEIEATIAKLKALHLNAEILPLHGGLEPAEQSRCFRGYGRPKVVVSTNVAETSVTIADIDAVVDSGLERRVEVRDGVEGLYLAPVSVANTNQRAGRAGRTKEGIYVLCSTESRPEWPTAEIQRSRLDQLILRLAMAGFDAETLEFFHQPEGAEIKRAKQALIGLGALDNQTGQVVTSIGRQMSRFPVEVHYARMILSASQYGVVDDVLTVVACLEAGGILDRSGKCRSFFGLNETESDLLAQKTVFDFLSQMRERVDYREAGVFGKAYHRAREIRRHLVDAIRQVKGIRFGSHGSRQDVLKACSAGMVDHLYRKTYGGRYANGNGERELARESVLQKRSTLPDWLVGQPFDLGIQDRRGRSMTLHLIKDASAIEPAWLAEVAPHLASTIRRNYRWSEEQGEVICDEVLNFKSAEVAITLVTADQCAQATKALARQLAQIWLCGEVGKACNAELAELQAKSAGVIRGPLSLDNVTEIFAERLGEIYRIDDPAVGRVDLSISAERFASCEDANRIRRENPDTVQIGDETCAVGYKFVPADSWYNRPARTDVTITVSVATIVDASQLAVEHLIPSGVTYTLQLGDEGYTAISGTDVSTLREQIEVRRLEIAWQTFRRVTPDTCVTVKGLGPLPAVPEPKTYDVVSGALAHPALVKGYDEWTIRWFQSEPEAKESQAKAIEAKAKLDAEEDERINCDRYVASAFAEATAVADLLGQIDLDKFQSYGLSDKEAGKSYWSSEESLANKIEQAKGLLTEDRYYGRKPQPVKALGLLATTRARVNEALEYFQANETKRPEAETALALVREERQAIAEFYRENLLSYGEDREVESLTIKATEAFEKGDYVTTLSLYEELTAKTAELRTKAEVGLRQKEECKKSANDRLRNLLATCPVCNSPMCEEQPEWGDQIRLVCRNTTQHPTERVLWAQSNSGLTQYDHAVLATVQPEGTYKSRDQIASVNIHTDGTVTAEWDPTDDTRPFERTDYVTDVVLTPEAWQARARERYGADRQYAEEQVSNGYWFRLQFREGRHPQTGEVQWEAGSKRVKYVLDRHSQTPTLGETYYVSQVRELVNTGTFRLIVVRLEPPYPEHYTAPSTADKAVAEPTKAKKKATEESSQDEIAVAQAQLEALKARFNRAK